MVILNGRTIDRFDADRLHDWVASAESEFTPEEHRRAKRAVTYLKSKVRGPSVLAPRVSLYSVVNLIAVFIVLICLMGTGRASPMLAQLHAEFSSGDVLKGALMVQGGYLLTFLCFAGMSVGWPLWLRVVIAILGFASLLWIFITGMVLIVSAKGAVGGFAALIFVGLIVWFIFLVAKSGNR